MKKILVIDSSAIIHRSFHGMPLELVFYNNEKININILRGYVNYINRLYFDFNFDDCIHVLDPEGGSLYRKTIYPEYKFGRPEEDPSLTIQKKIIPNLLNSFKQKYICIPGVESDDVMASIARNEALKGNIVLVLSPDKDLLQIVEDGKISVGRLTKNKQGKNVHDLYEELGVYQKFGVNTYQIPDFLALVGDVSDNIKGVPGVGEKLAAKLLNHFYDIETIIMESYNVVEQSKNNKKNKSLMTYRIAENIQSVADNLPLMKKLTTALTDINIPDINDININYTKTDNYFFRKLLNISDSWNDNLESIT